MLLLALAGMVSPLSSAWGGNACLAQAGGVGGTGIAGGSGGIGGTGALAKGGIGGTGIIGIVTGFGSICVNGIEVQYNRKTPVEVNGDRASVHELALGEIVSVEAEGVGGEVRARAISIWDRVFGRLDSVDAARGELALLKQTVRVRPSTVYSDRGAHRSPGSIISGRVSMCG